VFASVDTGVFVTVGTAGLFVGGTAVFVGIATVLVGNGVSVGLMMTAVGVRVGVPVGVGGTGVCVGVRRRNDSQTGAAAWTAAPRATDTSSPMSWPLNNTPAPIETRAWGARNLAATVLRFRMRTKSPATLIQMSAARTPGVIGEIRLYGPISTLSATFTTVGAVNRMRVNIPVFTDANVYSPPVRTSVLRCRIRRAP
jgi:hypothetical protein